MKRTVYIFSALIIVLLLLFQISKYAIYTNDLTLEFTIAFVAIVFFFIGVLLNKKSSTKTQISQEDVDLKKLKTLSLSDREYEVLKEIASGLSNKEIAEKLFLTESTIKTHVSNLFVKLNAKRRTQAIRMAKEMRII
ncbi:response regulator transcription factor [Maribacter aestuarii]|uniref:response regulator transcription factor n=1 Tax=Maribacter aestuarii TaxID=1130723 RepID=UPI00248C1A65|nr:response regulator transcription factor [Maribacter aestuarii]